MTETQASSVLVALSVAKEMDCPCDERGHTATSLPCLSVPDALADLDIILHQVNFLLVIMLLRYRGIYNWKCIETIWPQTNYTTHEKNDRLELRVAAPSPECFMSTLLSFGSMSISLNNKCDLSCLCLTRCSGS